MINQKGLLEAYATYDKNLLPSEQMEAAITAYLPHHESALQNAVVILPDGAEPVAGDLVEYLKTKSVRAVSKVEDYVVYYVDEVIQRYCMLCYYKDCKIIQRNGKPVIYQSALSNYNKGE